MMKRVAALAVAVGALIALMTPVSSQQGKSASSKETLPVLIAASATSYGEGANSVICLLDEKCDGFWMPMSKDGGVNEGIYLQFREPVEFGAFDVTVEGQVSDILELKVYFDGMTGSDAATRTFREKKAAQEDVRRRKIRKEVEKEWGKQGAPYTTPDEVDAGGNYDGDQIRVEAVYDAPLTHFQISHGRASYKVKSIFIKINAISPGNSAPKFKAIRFFKNADAFAEKRIAESAKPLAIALPLPAKAEVSASSTLSPVIAYGPEHLFDSQYDMAWATDGKKSNGIGESVSVRFKEKQTIQSLMLWNGYQRSDAHYKANGRVSALAVNGETIAVADSPTPQTLRLAKPVETDNVTLTIKDIYKGDAYKDVLISELRFLGPDDRIILPRVEGKTANVPALAAPLVDRTFASFIQVLATSDAEYIPAFCSDTSLRLRSDGSFVIYADYLDGRKNDEKYEPGVIEGNWEQGQDARSLRLFGKRYRVPPTDLSGYLSLSKATENLPGPRIFQSQLRIVLFNDLSEKEQSSVLAFLADRRFVKGKEKAVRVDLNLAVPLKNANSNEGEPAIEAPTLNAALAKLLLATRELNPLYVKSDVYTDLLVPQDKASRCSH